VLDAVIKDFAVELFTSIDVDGSGTLTNEEIREAILERKNHAESVFQKTSVGKKFDDNWQRIIRQIPGTLAHQDWLEDEEAKLADVQGEYAKFLEYRKKMTLYNMEKRKFHDAQSKEEEMGARKTSRGSRIRRGSIDSVELAFGNAM